MNDKDPSARLATDRAHSADAEFHVTLDGIPVALVSWDPTERWWVLTNVDCWHEQPEPVDIYAGPNPCTNPQPKDVRSPETWAIESIAHRYLTHSPVPCPGTSRNPDR